LAARLNLKRFFHLINDVTGLGRTGETVVGKKIDKEVVLMAPTRHDPGAALLRKVTIGANESRALQEASRGQTGEGQTIDYRGQFVFASWQYVPSLDWGLVVKIDYAEAMQVVEESRETTLALTGVIVLLAIAASVVVSQAFVAPLLELQSATQRISRGDFNVALDIRSRDEIGELADSFDRMIAAIKFFREHSRHEEDEPEQAETSQDASEKTE
jgi:methyl-accepting chemotaxis protein